MIYEGYSYSFSGSQGRFTTNAMWKRLCKLMIFVDTLAPLKLHVVATGILLGTSTLRPHQ